MSYGHNFNQLQHHLAIGPCGSFYGDVVSFENKSPTVFFINAGFSVVSLLVMGLVSNGPCSG